jgi:hypothetical protein
VSAAAAESAAATAVAAAAGAAAVGAAVASAMAAAAAAQLRPWILHEIRTCCSWFFSVSLKLDSFL